METPNLEEPLCPLSPILSLPLYFSLSLFLLDSFFMPFFPFEVSLPLLKTQASCVYGGVGGGRRTFGLAPVPSIEGGRGCGAVKVWISEFARVFCIYDCFFCCFWRLQLAV